MARLSRASLPAPRLVRRQVVPQQPRRLAVERVVGVRVGQQLGKQRLDNRDKVVHGRPLVVEGVETDGCLLYTSPSPRDATLSRMPSSA